MASEVRLAVVAQRPDTTPEAAVESLPDALCRKFGFCLPLTQRWLRWQVRLTACTLSRMRSSRGHASTQQPMTPTFVARWYDSSRTRRAASSDPHLGKSGCLCAAQGDSTRPVASWPGGPSLRRGATRLVRPNRPWRIAHGRRDRVAVVSQRITRAHLLMTSQPGMKGQRHGAASSTRDDAGRGASLRRRPSSLWCSACRSPTAPTAGPASLADPRCASGGAGLGEAGAELPRHHR